MIQTAIVVGANGKMGKIACNALIEYKPNISVIPVTRADNLSEVISQSRACIALELTDVNSVYSNSQVLLEHGIPTVIGASGLTSEQKHHLNQLAVRTDVPCLIVPNFSIAAVLMNQAAKLAAPFLNDCEIIEYHHTQKKDAPSATSIDTANQVKLARLNALENSDDQNAHWRGSVPIHSIRCSGVLAKQDVIFAQRGETLTISLNQIDRYAFAPGLCMAMERITTLPAGIHTGIENVFDFDVQNISP